MAEINQTFKVKKGLDVTGNAAVSGYITTTTQAQTENSTKVATTEFVKTAVNTAVTGILNSAPAALDTLNELAAALGNDSSFATTMTNSLALKAPLASPTFTGVPAAPTAAAGTNTTQLATTAFVTTADNLKANLASPTFTGVPAAPTAAVDTNTTQLATTAFVIGQAATAAPSNNGTAAVGTSLKWARQDHVHATDSTRAPLSSPTFTGDPKAPTPSKFDNDTSIATTAWVSNLGLHWKNDAGLGVTSNLTLTSNDTGKWFDIQSAGLTVTLPALSTCPAGYSTYTFRARHDFNIQCDGTEVIEGTDQTVNLYTVRKGMILTLVSNGSGAWYVVSQGSSLNSPTFVGIPRAPTASANNNSTQIATTAYVDAADALKAPVNNPSFTGDVTVSGGINSVDYRTLIMPKGAKYNSSVSAATGSIKIVLPVLYNSTMMTLTVRVFEYGTGKSFDLVISGYNYSSTSTWMMPSCYVIGEPGCKIPTVRFGNDATNACIWIGELADVWAYPQIQVAEARLGYTGATSAWFGDWNILLVTAFDTVKITSTPSKTATLASPAFTGTPTAPTATAGTNSTQIATTAYVDSANALKSNIASPAFTGTPTAPTATAGTNSTQIATTAFVTNAVSSLVAAAPAALDTLNELATALGNDASFSTTVTNSLALKAPLASPSFTGDVTSAGKFIATGELVVRGGGAGGQGGQLTLGYGNNASTTITGQANSVWAVDVDAGNNFRIFRQGADGSTLIPITIADSNGKATIAYSPDLTGTPTAPSAATTVDTTQIATTAFVHSALDATLSKPITGSAVLSAAEATYRNIIFTGALTANAVITIPTANARYIIDNRTTGAFTLTVKMASGTGVNVAQNYRMGIFSDGANVYRDNTDYTDVYIGGVPTTTTASTTDNSTRIATTAYVNNAITDNAIKISADSSDPFGLETFNQTLTLGTTWLDTGISGTDLTTGSYMVQVYANDSAVGGGHSAAIYTGQMSWYSGSTSNTDNDEIPLHQAGAAYGSNSIYLRTMNTVGGTMKLQISSNLVNSGSSTYTFKFRRII